MTLLREPYERMFYTVSRLPGMEETQIISQPTYREQ